MVYRINSTKSLYEIERGLHESAARHQFGVIAIHDLRETLRKKGVELAMDCRIYEVCNPASGQESARRRWGNLNCSSLPYFGLWNGKAIHACDNTPHGNDARLSQPGSRTHR